MSQNPYAPPSAPGSFEPPSAQAQNHGRGRFDLGDALSEAWTATWSDFGTLLAGALLFVVLTGVLNATIIGGLVVGPVLLWGGIRFMLNYFDGRGRIEDLFSGFRSFGAALGSMLLLGLAMSLFFVPFVALMGAAEALGSWVLNLASLVAFLAATFVLVRFQLAPLYVVDQELGALEGLSASWEATGAQWGMSTLLSLVSSVVLFLGLFALGVGLLVTAPLAFLMSVSAYRQIAGRPRGAVEDRRG